MNPILRLSLDSVRRRWWLYLLTAAISLSRDPMVWEAFGFYPILLGAWLLVVDYARHTWRAYDSVPARPTDVTKAIWCQGAVLLPLLHVAVGLVSRLYMTADYPVEFRETLPQVCVYLVPAFGILILLFFEPESPASTLLGHLRGLAFLVVIVAALVAAPSLVLAWHIRHDVFSLAPFTLIGVFMPTGLMCIVRVKEGHCGSSYSALRRWYLWAPPPSWATDTTWGPRFIKWLVCFWLVNQILLIPLVFVRYLLGATILAEDWYLRIGSPLTIILLLALRRLTPRSYAGLVTKARTRSTSRAALPAETWLVDFFLAFGVTLIYVLFLHGAEGSIATPVERWDVPQWALVLAVPLASLPRCFTWVTSLRALRPLPLSAARLTLLLISFLAVHLTGIVLAMSMYLIVTHGSASLPSAAGACAIAAAVICAVAPSFASLKGMLLLLAVAFFGTVFFNFAIDANISLAHVSTLTWAIIWLALMSVGIVRICWTITRSSAAYKRKPLTFDLQARRP